MVYWFLDSSENNKIMLTKLRNMSKIVKNVMNTTI